MRHPDNSAPDGRGGVALTQLDDKAPRDRLRVQGGRHQRRRAMTGQTYPRSRLRPGPTRRPAAAAAPLSRSCPAAGRRHWSLPCCRRLCRRIPRLQGRQAYCERSVVVVWWCRAKDNNRRTPSSSCIRGQRTCRALQQAGQELELHSAQLPELFRSLLEEQPHPVSDAWACCFGVRLRGLWGGCETGGNDCLHLFDDFCKRCLSKPLTDNSVVRRIACKSIQRGSYLLTRR